MTDFEYRQAIDDVKNKFVAMSAGKSVGVIVPAAMEMILNAILSIDDKSDAMKAAASLRPMIDYIEGQISGQH